MNGVRSSAEKNRP